MAQYWNGNTNSFEDIPRAPWYVLSNDPFMSDWKHGVTEGKINTCVVPCDSYEEAEGVRAYIESRGDQKYIRINYTPPRNKSHVLYSMPRWKETARALGYLK